MKKAKEPNLKLSEIQEDPFYKKTKLTVERNLTGEYSHQVIGFALQSLEKKLGKLSVSLLVKEVPRIAHIVVVPDEYLTV